jgi:hypothetical protein
MAGVNKFGQTGVGSNVKFGKSGSRIKETGGQLEARNAADSALTQMRGADPIDDQDFVTKGYLEKTADIRVVGEIYDNAGVTGSPSNANIGDIYIAKDTVGLFLANYLYRFKNAVAISAAISSDFEEIPVSEALKITVSDELANGGFTLTADHVYIWDEDNTVWTDGGLAASQVDASKSEKDVVVFSDAPSKVLENIKAGSSVLKAVVKVTTPFDDAAELTIGYAGSQSSVMAASEVDLQTAGTYISECFVEFGSDTDVLAYISQTPTVGQLSIELGYVNH